MSQNFISKKMNLVTFYSTRFLHRQLFIKKDLTFTAFSAAFKSISQTSWRQWNIPLVKIEQKTRKSSSVTNSFELNTNTFASMTPFLSKSNKLNAFLSCSSLNCSLVTPALRIPSMYSATKKPGHSNKSKLCKWTHYL